mgnify:CR=1 FL=1
MTEAGEPTWGPGLVVCVISGLQRLLEGAHECTETLHLF